ncbi:MAG: PilN domain-containing protein [Proteobacteria bacterium]|nr:PilN domain-containing protein [Pseudomonadota bacterium]
MIRINLLPFRAARTKENVRRQVSIFILLIILLLVGMGAYRLHLGIKTNEEKNKTQAIKTELEKYTQKAKEVDLINKENETLQKKINIIGELEKVRKEPILLFEALTDVFIEERMWLTNFDVKDKGIVIKGMALDEITVADFTKRLQNSAYYDDVVLKFLKQIVANDIKMKSFEISASIAKVDTKKTNIDKALK